MLVWLGGRGDAGKLAEEKASRSFSLGYLPNTDFVSEVPPQALTATRDATREGGDGPATALCLRVSPWDGRLDEI